MDIKEVMMESVACELYTVFVEFIDIDKLLYYCTAKWTHESDKLPFCPFVLTNHDN